MKQELMRVDEMAKRLGVSNSRVYQLIAKGELPAVRVGRAICCPAAAWRAWLARLAKEATRELRQ